MAGNQAAFVQQYKMELQDLTFNSKAIINNLTMLASENKEAGAGIAEAITQHIKLSPPPFRLPALYLLDSIVKNVGLPYTALFASDVPEIYMSVWRAAPQSRPSLQRLLGTWQKFFPQDILRRIGQYLAEDQFASQSAPSSQPPMQPRQSHPQQAYHNSRPAMEQRPPFYPQAQPMSQPPVSYPSMPQLGYQNSIQGPPVSYGQPNYQNLPPPPSPPQRNYAAAYTPTYPGPQSAAGQITPEISPQRPQSNSGVQAPAALNGLPAFLSQLVDAGIIPPSGPSAAALSVTTPTESVPLTFSNFNRQDLSAIALSKLRAGTEATKPALLDQRLIKKRKSPSGVSYSRQWYVKEKDWLAGTTASAEAAPAFFDDAADEAVGGTKRDASETEITSVPADPDQPTCALSGERFDSFWDDATNEWRFQGAVALTEDQAARYGLIEGQLVKISCLTPTVASGIDSANETIEDAANQQTASDMENAIADEVSGRPSTLGTKVESNEQTVGKHGIELESELQAKRLKTA